MSFNTYITCLLAAVFVAAIVGIMWLALRRSSKMHGMALEGEKVDGSAMSENGAAALGRVIRRVGKHKKLLKVWEMEHTITAVFVNTRCETCRGNGTVKFERVGGEGGSVVPEGDAKEDLCGCVAYIMEPLNPEESRFVDNIQEGQK